MSRPRISCSLADLPRRMFKLGAVGLPALTRAIREGFAVEMYVTLPRQTPVGDRKTDPHPGLLRASWTLSAGAPSFAGLTPAPSYPVPGAPEAEKALRGWNGVSRLYFSNDAADEGRESYAASIEAGLREKNGRMYGSPNAPEGILQPSLAIVDARREQIMQNAISRANEIIAASGL